MLKTFKNIKTNMKLQRKKRKITKRKIDPTAPIRTQVNLYRSILTLAEKCPFEYHQLVEFTVKHLTPTGEGLGAGEMDGKQWPIVVPFALPGEKVVAKIFREEE